MSKLEVDKIIPQSGTAIQVGESGDTITIPAGATITNNGTANGFGSADTEKVKVSANDTTAGFLNGKLVAGTNISLTEGSDGGNETLTAALTGTIATAQIADDAVTLAKMAPGTDGNIISYDASGNPVAVATGSAGQVLTSAGAGAPPTFAAAGGGKVLQVLNATDGTQRSTTSTSYVTGSNTLSIDITPSATSSKILVLAACSMYSNKSSGHGGYFTIYRDSTNLITGNSNDGMGTVGFYIPGQSSGYIFNTSAMQVLDSPNTTSQVTYQVYFKMESGHSGEIRLNGQGMDSSITCLEIGA